MHREKKPAVTLCSSLIITALCAVGLPAFSQDQCIGWATVDGTVTGGAGGETVTVTTASELTSAISREGKRTIKVRGKIAVQRISMSERTDLTLEGAERGAELETTFYLEQASNIIFRNLIISAVNGGQMDIFAMEENTHHIWVDHCDISDKRPRLDGLIDMTHACDNITISWNKFHYPDPSIDHRFAMLISHSDDAGGEDAGKERITIHHNWWADNITERMPRARFGQIHVFNNYYHSIGNNYCIGPGVDAKVVVESNYFDNVKDPHIFFNDEPSAQIRINDDNQYVNATGSRDEGQGSAFVVPYPYRLDRGADVKNIVMAGAGPFGRPAGIRIQGGFTMQHSRRNSFQPVCAPKVFSLLGYLVPAHAPYASMPVIIVNEKPVVKIHSRLKQK
ncbi:MAG: hypothetical protein JXA71_17340 [Chitinispirillaceae bacterium]|nr:hypothetical protein [Chitinispirillaceae bacterium]